MNELFFPGVEAEVLEEPVELVYFGSGGGDEGLTCGGLEGEGGGVLRGGDDGEGEEVGGGVIC